MLIFPKQRILHRIGQEAKILEDCFQEGRELSDLVIAGAKAQRKKLEATPFSKFQTKKREAQGILHSRLKRIETEYSTGIERAKDAFDECLNRIREEVNELLRFLQWAGLAFEDPLWSRYKALKNRAAEPSRAMRKQNDY